MSYPNDFQRRTLWSAGTGIAIVILGSILVGAIWLGGQVLGYLQPVLVPLAVAGIVAYLLDPVVAWLQQHQKLSRLKAVLTVFGVFTLIITIFFSLLIPRLLDQAGRLVGDEDNLGENVLRYLEKTQDSIPGVRPLVDWATGPVNPVTGEVTPKPYPFPVYKDKKLLHYVTRSGETIEPVKAVPSLKQRERAKAWIEASEQANVSEESSAEESPETSSEAITEATTEDKPENIPEQPFPFPVTNDLGVITHYLTKAGQKVEIVEPVPSFEERKAAQQYEKEVNSLKFNDRKIGTLLTENWQTLTKTALTWLQATTKVFGLLGYLLGFLLVPVYLYYFLNESAKIKSTWHQYIPLKASKFKDEVVSALSEINSYLISFFRGQVLVSLIDGILVGIALSIFQLPYGFLIGLALAVIGILPFIGNIICMVPAAFIAYIHFGSADANHQWLGENSWAYVGAVIAIFLVVQQINSLVTAPKIVGDSVGLHPMTVIFSILFWSLILGGFLGALMAVPLTAAVKVIFSRYVWQRRISPQLQDLPNDAMLSEASTDT